MAVSQLRGSTIRRYNLCQCARPAQCWRVLTRAQVQVLQNSRSHLQVGEVNNE